MISRVLLLLGVLASAKAQTCTRWQSFGSAAPDGIDSPEELTSNGWTFYANYFDHTEFPTSPDYFQFLENGGGGNGYIEKTLPEGYDFVRVRYGNVYNGITNVEVGGVNVGAAVADANVTTDADYTFGDTIKVLEMGVSVSVIYSIDLCINTPPPPPPTCTRWQSFGSAAPDGIDSPEELTSNGWTFHANYFDHTEFPTSPDYFQFLENGGGGNGYIEKALPEGYDFVRVRYGNVYNGITNVEVGGVNVGAAVADADVTTDADYTVGDTIKVLEMGVSVSVIYSIDLCKYEAGACFHRDGTVLLESGSSKRLLQLSLGERIMTSDGRGGFSFNPVLTLPHANNTEPAAFLTLTTETGKKVDMTSDHFIPKCDQEQVTAGELVVGDCLMTVDGKETLVDISWSKKSGVFTAVTENKFIVVDGIVASPYSKNSDPNYPIKDYEKYRIELELERTRAHFARKEAVQKTPNRNLRGN